jgi:hypothetical protein
MNDKIEQRKSKLKAEIAMAKDFLQENLSTTKPLDYVLPDLSFFKRLISKVTSKLTT